MNSSTSFFVDLSLEGVSYLNGVMGVRHHVKFSHGA
ncbi:hypothetical protein BACCIP111895_02449 [Neobacillus rhizosphaerae]|jgi:hypothetical protein|uniref:Uncharacterized protein n=1 Tax=Neobacillus rhizosphaerae TaxID=2880965 RepID=A0ABM9ET24_9BACI|nr:hypothetical protein BACCIP111895_02449 [Neobacillus rhizosphaerae]